MNIGPLGTIGVAIKSDVGRLSRPVGSGGVTMMRPCAVAGRWGSSTTPVISSPPATVTVATEASAVPGPAPNDMARSWYSPGATPETVKLPSGLIVEPEWLMNIIAMSPPPRIVCVTITLPPLSGLPSPSSASAGDSSRS